MKYLSMIVVIFVILIGILASNNALPACIQQCYDFPYGDKLLHFFLIGSCNGALILLAHQNKQIQMKRVLGVTLFTLTAATIEEFSQQAFPHRTFSYKDLAANYMGIISVALLIVTVASIVHRKREKTISLV